MGIQQSSCRFLPDCEQAVSLLSKERAHEYVTWGVGKVNEANSPRTACPACLPSFVHDLHTVALLDRKAIFCPFSRHIFRDFTLQAHLFPKFDSLIGQRRHDFEGPHYRNRERDEPTARLQTSPRDGISQGPSALLPPTLWRGHVFPVSVMELGGTGRSTSPSPQISFPLVVCP